jgi:hypothetical protein
MIQTYSLHQITQTDQLDFLPYEYSRFKFGDSKIAKRFGESLAKQFIKDCLATRNNIAQLVVISSPYSFIPTATFAMKIHFVFELNKWLVQKRLPTVLETKIHRDITYKEDYGALTAEERIKLIEKDSFHIDESFLRGKELIFLDDIRITGSHEKMILRMMNQFNLTNHGYLLYFANLINPAIEPQFENYLNYYGVNSIFDLESIIKEDFLINTRIVKYILNAPSGLFEVFIEKQSEDFCELLFNMAIGNNYHLIDAYSPNLGLLQQLLKQKSIVHL